VFNPGTQRIQPRFASVARLAMRPGVVVWEEGESVMAAHTKRREEPLVQELGLIHSEFQIFSPAVFRGKGVLRRCRQIKRFNADNVTRYAFQSASAEEIARTPPWATNDL
jgi:hypothetical protein